MFTSAAVTAVAAFLGGDLLTLALGRLMPAPAAKAAGALVKVLRVIDDNAEHLPESAKRQIAREALAAGHASKASIYSGWVRGPYST
jgi:hypothetical protein